MKRMGVSCSLTGEGGTSKHSRLNIQQLCCGAVGAVVSCGYEQAAESEPEPRHAGC